MGVIQVNDVGVRAQGAAIGELTDTTMQSVDTYTSRLVAYQSGLDGAAISNAQDLSNMVAQAVEAAAATALNLRTFMNHASQTTGGVDRAQATNFAEGGGS